MISIVPAAHDGDDDNFHDNYDDDDVDDDDDDDNDATSLRVQHGASIPWVTLASIP